MKHIVIFLLLLFVASCGSKKPLLVSENTITKDSTSTVTTVTPRDTTIVVPKDSVSIVVPIEELTETPKEVVSESGRSKARISKVDDTIKVECLFEELDLKLQLLDKQIEVLRLQSQTKTITQTIEVPYTPWYKELFFYIGLVAAGGFLFKKFKFL